VNSARLQLAVSRVPQRRPNSIRGPGGFSTLTFKFLPRRAPCSEAAGRFGRLVKCARNLAIGEVGATTPNGMFIRATIAEMRVHLARRESGAAASAAQHSRSRWAATLGFQAPPSSVQVVGGRRPVGEMRPHPARRESRAAAPAAQPRWAGVSVAVARTRWQIADLEQWRRQRAAVQACGPSEVFADPD